jgi:hypothetical protein
MMIVGNNPSDGKFWSITIESSFTLLGVSLTLLQASFITFIVQAAVAVIINYNCNMFKINTRINML